MNPNAQYFAAEIESLVKHTKMLRYKEDWARETFITIGQIEALLAEVGSPTDEEKGNELAETVRQLTDEIKNEESKRQKIVYQFRVLVSVATILCMVALALFNEAITVLAVGATALVAILGYYKKVQTDSWLNSRIMSLSTYITEMKRTLIRGVIDRCMQIDDEAEYAKEINSLAPAELSINMSEVSEESLQAALEDALKSSPEGFASLKKTLWEKTSGLEPDQRLKIRKRYKELSKIVSSAEIAST